MSVKATIWVHGLTAQDENPVQTGVPRGWGKEFLGRWRSKWFHLPLTPPVSLEHVRPKLPRVFGFNIPLTDARPRLTKVFVLYKTNGAFIDALHIYDGRSIVQAFPHQAFPHIAFEGDHAENSDPANTWDIYPSLEISFGLAVSVLVTNNVYKQIEAQEDEAAQGEEAPKGDEATQGEQDTTPSETAFLKKERVIVPPASVLFTAAGAEFEIPESDDIQSGRATNTLLPNERLRIGDFLISGNGRYKLDYEANGNLVLKNTADNSPAGFETGTLSPPVFGPNAYCEMQADGNFVVHHLPLGPSWDTETWDHHGAFLRVEDEGKVVIIDPTARIWRRP